MWSFVTSAVSIFLSLLSLSLLFSMFNIYTVASCIYAVFE